MKLNRTVVCAVLAIAILGASAWLAQAADATYRASIEKWRQGYEASLKSDEGWLTVSGLFWLHEGENHFGTDPLNDIVLPATAGAADAGAFVLHNAKTVVYVSRGVNITLNGKPVETVELRPDLPSDRLRWGDLTLYVHASGQRFALRIKDKNSKIRKEFTGLHWFPIDESYRVVGRYIPYNPPKQADIPTVLGDVDKVPIVGAVVFTLHGQEYRLDAEQDEPGTLSFVFRDLTSGKETYAAARFLDTEAAKNGAVVLDFNEAYNPPCAYNPYTTCPLPTPENRLRVAIPAGEKIYQAEHAK